MRRQDGRYIPEYTHELRADGFAENAYIDTQVTFAVRLVFTSDTIDSSAVEAVRDVRCTDYQRMKISLAVSAS
jgi:hypothetical protein